MQMLRRKIRYRAFWQRSKPQCVLLTAVVLDELGGRLRNDFVSRVAIVPNGPVEKNANVLLGNVAECRSAGLGHKVTLPTDKHQPAVVRH